MKFYRRSQTKKISIGNVTIGGGAPIAVQSMTNTNSRDLKSTIVQIKQLEEAGCEIVRVSFPDLESVCNIKKIKKSIKIPLVADIHFDYRIALEAIKQGVDKLRINPGNIGSKDKVEILVREAKRAHVPIRIGVNAGSLKKIHRSKSDLLRAKALVNVVMEHVEILEKNDFDNVVVSLKSSNIYATVRAYEIFASKRNYPLHLGITEAGPIFSGSVKSAAGLGIMLYNGIGDTVRASLTANPVEEVKLARSLLQSMGFRSFGIDIVSCPTCARCQVDLIKIVSEFEKKTSGMKGLKRLSKPVKVAIMGCIVNGPGEAKDADFGIAGGKDVGVLFKDGKIVDKVNPDEWIPRLISMIRSYQGSQE
ncbi:MAG: flavodoxin-dependent (E)-4-hydroxy-3-methylbut-2-enyl-diphosphate synthase [Endomicrobium sp.]|jgi:(E)-4-hydroxy-3-methylbut-2-enyl-diphosphate synthase|nr:flavodoxin-dependent (E)-4-hydroxy-3-methylbut-2-enyl-diphosphate synthase [Endomicrobium sp.]